MIDYQTYCAIREAHERDGLSARQIAAKLGVHPETVAKWIKRTRYEQRKAPPRGSKLDAYKGTIMRLLETHPYSAAQMLERLREAGYDGGYSILKRFKAAQEALRSDLFENRLAAFLKLRQYFESVSSHGTVNVQGWHKLIEAQQMCVFLFGDDINAFLAEIRVQADKLYRIQSRRNDPLLTPPNFDREEEGTSFDVALGLTFDFGGLLNVPFQKYMKFGE